MSEQVIDITKLEISKLKEIAYDLLIEQKKIAQNLAIIENELLSRKQKEACKEEVTENS